MCWWEWWFVYEPDLYEVKTLLALSDSDAQLTIIDWKFAGHALSKHALLSCHCKCAEVVEICIKVCGRIICHRNCVLLFVYMTRPSILYILVGAVTLYLVGAAYAQWKIKRGSFVKCADQNFPLIFRFVIYTLNKTSHHLFFTRQSTVLTKLPPYFHSRTF